MTINMAPRANRKINWHNFWICFWISSGQLAFGYPASVIGVTLGQPSFLLYMKLIDEEGVLASNAAGLIGAMNGVFQAGACVGALITAWINDRFGRKAAVRFCVCLSLVGGTILCASQNIGMFIAFRFFAGAGSWGLVSVLPTYTAELAPAELRGFFVGLNGIFISVGYCLASYMGLAFYFTNQPSVQWRAPLGLALIWPVLMALVTIWTPESPRYLLSIGQTEKAWSIVSRLHSSKEEPDDTYARQEFFQMRKQAEAEKSMNSSWLEMFRKPSYLKRSLMVMALAFIGQSTGVLVIVNYAPSIYKTLGFDTVGQLALSCGYITVSLPAAIFGAWIMDRVGRRPMLIGAIGGCCSCLILVTALVATYAEAGTNHSALAATVFALYLFIAFYSAGIDTCGFVYFAELFPNHLRAKGLALVIATICITDIVYLQVSPTAFANIGWKFYLVFVIISGLGFIYMYFTIPETKGIPLEEVAKLFGDDGEVEIFARDIHIDATTHEVSAETHAGSSELLKRASEPSNVEHVEAGTERAHTIQAA